MTESILIFGVAANAMQFIDFGSKVLSASYRLYKTGTGDKGLEANRELEVITKSLQKLIEGLESSLREDESKQALTQNELAIRELASGCKDVAEELITAVQKLKIEGKSGKWNSFRTALKALWSEDKIDSIQQRLNKLRQELVVHILVSFRYV